MGIRFCGGCNPRIDRERVAREVEEALAGPEISVVYAPREADFFLFVSGCPSGCAFRAGPAGSANVIVAGSAVGGLAVGERQLAGEAARRVREHHERLEAELRNEDRDRRRGPEEG